MFYILSSLWAQSPSNFSLMSFKSLSRESSISLMTMLRSLFYLSIRSRITAHFSSTNFVILASLAFLSSICLEIICKAISSHLWHSSLIVRSVYPWSKEICLPILENLIVRKVRYAWVHSACRWKTPPFFRIRSTGRWLVFRGNRFFSRLRLCGLFWGSWSFPQAWGLYFQSYVWLSLRRGTGVDVFF